MRIQYATVIQFPITPVKPSYGNSLVKHLYSTIVNPRLREGETLWLDHTTEHPTQYDRVCFEFESLGDATSDAQEIACALAQEVDAFFEKNKDAAEIWELEDL